jgi:hypothetical protein
VLTVAVLIVLVSAAVLLSRRYGAAGPVRTCCSNARWPPDDLTDPQRQAPASIDGPSPPRSAPSHHS